MTPRQLNEVATLAMIRAYPQMSIDQGIRQGRLRGLCKKLLQECDITLSLYPAVSDDEKKKIGDLSEEFLNKSGWHKKGKAGPTFVSFLLVVAEDIRPDAPKIKKKTLAKWLARLSPGNYPPKLIRLFKHQQINRIIRLLNDIFDYYDRADKAPAPCLWGGEVNAQKWQEVFGC